MRRRLADALPRQAERGVIVSTYSSLDTILHVPKAGIEEGAVRCNCFSHPLCHLCVSFDLLIDTDQLVSHMDDLATPTVRSSRPTNEPWQPDWMIGVSPTQTGR